MKHTLLPGTKLVTVRVDQDRDVSRVLREGGLPFTMVDVEIAPPEPASDKAVRLLDEAAKAFAGIPPISLGSSIHETTRALSTGVETLSRAIYALREVVPE